MIAISTEPSHCPRQRLAQGSSWDRRGNTGSRSRQDHQKQNRRCAHAARTIGTDPADWSFASVTAPSHGLQANRCRAMDGTYDIRKCRDARAVWGQSGCKPICVAKPHRRGAYRIACPSSKDLKFTVVEIVLPAYRHLDVPFSQILLIVARQHSASIRMMGAAWRWRSDRDRQARGQVSRDLLGILEDCHGRARLNRSSLTT